MSTKRLGMNASAHRGLMNLLLLTISLSLLAAVVLHLFVGRRIVGSSKALTQVLLGFLLLPVIVSRLRQRTELSHKEKVWLNIEIGLVGFLALLIAVYVCASFRGILWPSPIRQYEPSLLGLRVSVAVDGRPLSATDGWALESIGHAVKDPSVLLQVLSQFERKDGQPDVMTLCSMYRDRLFLSVGDTDGVFYVQLTDTNVPFADYVLAELVTRLENATQGTNYLVSCNEGMKPFQLRAGSPVEIRDQPLK